MNGAKAGWQRETLMKESALKALAAQARLSQLLPLAMFNAADLEADALEGLIQKRRQAGGPMRRSEQGRL